VLKSAIIGLKTQHLAGFQVLGIIKPKYEKGKGLALSHISSFGNSKNDPFWGDFPLVTGTFGNASQQIAICGNLRGPSTFAHELALQTGLFRGNQRNQARLMLDRAIKRAITLARAIMIHLSEPNILTECWTRVNQQVNIDGVNSSLARQALKGLSRWYGMRKSGVG